jgi:hypothetical protein
MGLIDAGQLSALDRYVGYYQSYADSHKALDLDENSSRRCAMWRARWPPPWRSCAVAR